MEVKRGKYVDGSLLYCGERSEGMLENDMTGPRGSRGRAWQGGRGERERDVIEFDLVS